MKCFVIAPPPLPSSFSHLGELSTASPAGFTRVLQLMQMKVTDASGQESQW